MYGMGFSLKPPKWLRGATITGAGGQQIKITSSGIQLPGGAGYSVSPSGGVPQVFEQIKAAGESVPGGWLTIAAVIAAGAFFLFKRR